LAAETIKKFDNLLLEARAELKIKISECSELQKSQLATEFELKEIQRCKAEVENKLKYMQESHEEISKRNLELEAGINNLKFHLNRDANEIESPLWSESNESALVKETVEKLRLSRKLYEDFKEEISTDSESKVVEKLRSDLKEKETVHRRMVLHLNSAKQELESLNQRSLWNNRRQLDVYDEEDVTALNGQ